MAMLLLEAKPSLEGKVKAGGPGASPSPTWDSLDAGLLLWRHKSGSLRLPLSLRPRAPLLMSSIPSVPAICTDGHLLNA